MRKTTFLIILFSLFYIASYSQESKFHQIDSIFAFLNETPGPGCAVGIIKEGKLIYTGSYGKADIENNIDFTATTQFIIASNSKQFTAMCILMLAEKGMLDRNDDVRKYIPELPKYESTITINHLLHHTSGLRDYLELNYIACNYLGKLTKKSMLKLITDQKELNFRPGERHLYSNSNYFLLGLIVERVSKTPLHQFIRKNIFKPLGMNHTYFSEEKEVEQVTPSYVKLDSTYIKATSTKIAFYGDGGIISNINDLLIWDQNFYHNVLGNKNQKLIDEMQKTTRLTSGEEITWAAGLCHFNYKGIEAIMHGGGMANFHTQLVRFPAENLSIIWLANTASLDVDKYCLAIADIFLKDIEKPNEIKPGNTYTIPSDISGFYLSDGFPGYRIVMVENGQLRIGTRLYQQMSKNEFAAIDNRDFIRNAQFITSPNQPIQLIHEIEGQVDHFQLLKEDTLQKKMLGTYICKDLNNLEFELKFTEGQYHFLVSKKFRATIGKTFGTCCLVTTFNNAIVVFEKDNMGNATGFRLSGDRVINLLFTRSATLK